MINSAANTRRTSTGSAAINSIAAALANNEKNEASSLGESLLYCFSPDTGVTGTYPCVYLGAETVKGRMNDPTCESATTAIRKKLKKSKLTGREAVLLVTAEAIR